MRIRAPISSRFPFFAVFVSLTLLVTGYESPEPNTVEVVAYDGPPLNSTMNAGWRWETEAGAVVLTTVGPDFYPGDTSGVGHRLILIDSGTSLPIFGGFNSNSHLDGKRWTMQNGELAIQSFSLDGEVSGTITGRLWMGPGVFGDDVSSVFWVDLGDSTYANLDAAN